MEENLPKGKKQQNLHSPGNQSPGLHVRQLSHCLLAVLISCFRRLCSLFSGIDTAAFESRRRVRELSHPPDAWLFIDAAAAEAMAASAAHAAAVCAQRDRHARHTFCLFLSVLKRCICSIGGTHRAYKVSESARHCSHRDGLRQLGVWKDKPDRTLFVKQMPNAAP